MTRFGKSQINHDTLLSRNPSRSVVEKSISKLKANKEKIKSLTTKDIPYVGVAESAAIADLFNEPGSVDKDTLEAKFNDSDECLNSLAFTVCVDNFYKEIRSKLNQKTNNAILDKFFLDERVPIMLSVGITKILSDIIEALKKTSESAIDQSGTNRGKRIHFINVEDLFAYVDKHYGDVINLKQQRITDQNSNLKIYDVLKDITDSSYAASLAKDHVKRLLTGLTKVDEKHVGDTFSVTIADPHTSLGLDGCVANFLTACKRVVFVTNISAINNNYAKYAVGAIFGVIATHIMSYAFYSAIDEVLRSLEQANKKFSAGANPLDGKMFHRAMMYPSIVAALDLYGLSESTFDHAIAKEITTVKAVREVFKEAIKNYDYEASAIAAKTFRHAAPKVPSFLRSPEEILEAQMKLDKMLVTAPGTAGGPAAAVGKYTKQPSWITTNSIAGQKALTAMERAENTYGTWSFGKSRKSRKSRRSMKFGKSRKSRKSRRSMKFGEEGKVEVLFGRRRKSRRSMKFGEEGKVEVLFGRRRKSRRAAAFGKRRKSRRSMKFGEELQIPQFGKRRKSRRSSFGKRRGSKRRSMKFGNDMGDMVAGISFGKRRGSKRRASFGKRRGSKRRASFGKRRGSKRRASFGKRRGSKRRASFGKRRGSKRRN